MGQEATNEQVQSTESVTDDIDTIYNQVMGINEETSEPSSDNQANDGASGSHVNTSDLFTLKHDKFENGEVQLDRSKVTDYAQKGLDYEIKMRDIKTKESELETLRKDFEAESQAKKERYEELGQIDQYMIDNPEFARIVNEQWALAKGQTYKPVSPEVQALNERIAELQNRLDSQDKERMERSSQRAQESLDKSIASYKEANNGFDWNAKDEFGNTLQDRIEEFAVKREIKNFSDAANIMLHDQLMKQAAIKAKEDAAKELQKQNKLGLGPITSDSTLNIAGVSGRSSKDLSYAELAAEGLAEFGIN